VAHIGQELRLDTAGFLGGAALVQERHDRQHVERQDHDQ
jgi:hypothetical protein